MSMTKEQILAEAKALSSQERDELIEDLRQIAGDEDLSPEQWAELRRRIAAVDRGEVATIPGEQVMRELFQQVVRR